MMVDKLPLVRTAERSCGCRQWRWVLLVAIAVFAVKLLLSLQFSGPWYEQDESSYALRAYHLANGDGLHWRHQYRAPGKEGYPLFLSLSWMLAGTDTDLFFRIALISNCLLVFAMVLMGYAVLRQRFTHVGSLLGAAAMTLYAPVFLYGFSMLSENLFFVAFLAALWSVQQATRTARWYWWAAAGLAVAMTYSTRVSGIVLVIALAGTAAFEAIRSRKARRYVLAACSSLLGVAVVVGLMAFLAQPRPQVPTEIGIVESRAPENPLLEQVYGYRLTEGKVLPGWLTREGLFGTGRSLLWEIDYVFLAGFIVLPAMAVLYLLRSFRPAAADGGRRVDAGLLFLVLCLVGTLLAVSLHQGRSTTVTVESMYGRYIDVVAMALIGYGIAYACSGALATSKPSGGPSGVGVNAKMAKTCRKGRSRQRVAVSPVVVLAALAILTVITLPPGEVIFSGNFGVYYATWLGSAVAAKLAVVLGGLASESSWGSAETWPVRGGELIIAFLLLVTFGYALLASRYPRLLGMALLVLVAANTALIYPEVLKFREGFEPYRDFARSSAGPIQEQFGRHPQAPRAILIDDPPPAGQAPGGPMAIMFAVCNLELYNPDVQFVTLPKRVTVTPDTLLFSLRDRPFPVIHQMGQMRIYECRRLPSARQVQPSPKQQQGAAPAP